jgi:Ferrochelatase
MMHSSRPLLLMVDAPKQVISSLRAPKSSEGYRAIGGGSPLRKITLEQADALQEALGARGQPASVYVAMRYWKPFTEDAVAQVGSWPGCATSCWDGASHVGPEQLCMAHVCCAACELGRSTTLLTVSLVVRRRLVGRWSLLILRPVMFCS